LQNPEIQIAAAIKNQRQCKKLRNGKRQKAHPTRKRSGAHLVFSEIPIAAGTKTQKTKRPVFANNLTPFRPKNLF